MKRTGICILAVFFLLGVFITPSYAENGQKAPEKSIGTAISDDAKTVKKDFNKTMDASKEAIIRDVQSMKEDIPKGLKEAKDAAVQQSKDIRDSTTETLKEIRHNMSNPKLTPKTDNK